MVEAESIAIVDPGAGAGAEAVCVGRRSGKHLRLALELLDFEKGVNVGD